MFFLDEYNLELVIELMKRSPRDGWMDIKRKRCMRLIRPTD